MFQVEFSPDRTTGKEVTCKHSKRLFKYLGNINWEKEDGMKKISLCLILALMFVVHQGEILAQDKYPERPITAIIPYPPGSMLDLCTRAMGDLFPKYIGQALVPLNKPGSGGFIGGAAVATSKPDGYTVGIFANTQAVPELLAKFRPASYSSKDVMPVANWSGWLVVLACNSDAPYKTFNEFIEYAKKNPGKVKFGHPGVGNRYWMLGMAMAKETGIELKDVPFSGESEYRTALLGNHIDIALLTYGGASRENIQSKTLRALCVFESKRIDELPDVPTIKEVGYEYIYGTLFIGTFVPKGTPEGVIAKLNEATKKVVEDPQFKEKMKNLYMPIMYMDTKTFQTDIERDKDIAVKFLKEKGLL
jgi:tripartite-type tricarboxylate transporter receptor subunit TctC